MKAVVQRVSRASVVVDGRTLPATTPMKVSLVRGPHDVVIEKDGNRCSTTISISTFSGRTFQCELSSEALHTVR